MSEPEVVPRTNVCRCMEHISFIRTLEDAIQNGIKEIQQKTVPTDLRDLRRSGVEHNLDQLSSTIYQTKEECNVRLSETTEGPEGDLNIGVLEGIEEVKRLFQERKYNDSRSNLHEALYMYFEDLESCAEEGD